MRRAIALIAIGVLAYAAATALAGSYTAAHHGVKAKLTWRSAHNGIEYPVKRLTISRNGETLFSGPARPKLRTCESFGCSPTVGFGKPLTVRDLDGDSEPEVVFNAYSGGAHCCFVAQVWRYTGGAYAPRSRDFGNVSYRLADLGHDGRVEWLSADNDFAYAFTDFATSRFPVQILRFRRARFVDVTDRFPGRIRRDGRRHWREYKRFLHSDYKGTQYGPAAAWAADRYRLGKRHQALRILRREARRGHLESPNWFAHPWHGRKFVRRLDRFLRRRGY
jgi:hypothetical protein